MFFYNNIIYLLSNLSSCIIYAFLIISFIHAPKIKLDYCKFFLKKLCFIGVCFYHLLIEGFLLAEYSTTEGLLIEFFWLSSLLFLHLCCLVFFTISYAYNNHRSIIPSSMPYLLRYRNIILWQTLYFWYYF